MDSGRKAPRLHCIDAIRSFAFVLLIWFHAGLFFTDHGWHISLPWRIPGISEVLHFVSQWRMMLIFLASGTALSFSLDSRGERDFVGRSAARLLPPLIFGLLVLIAPVLYFERLGTTREITLVQSYREHFMALVHGDLRWLHLWYLGYLFAFCAGLAMMWRLVKPIVMKVRGWQFGTSARDLAMVAALCLPLVAAEVFLRPIFPTRRNFVSDWASIVEFGTAFMYGGMLLRNRSFFTLVDHYRHVLLLLAVAAYACLRLAHAPMLKAAFTGVNEWLWILTIVAWMYRHFNVRNRLVGAFNRIVFPFYLIHQLVLIAVAVLLAKFPWSSPLLLYLCIVAAALLICCVLITQVLMRIPVLAPLLGITPAEKTGVKRLAEG